MIIKVSALLALSASLSNSLMTSRLSKSPVQRSFRCNTRMNSDPFDFTCVVLGDLHLDPRTMEDHIEARQHFMPILEDGKRKNAAVVSLGDLGESKAVEPGTKELFAGTTRCFKLAADYLAGYKVLSLSLIALYYSNHPNIHSLVQVPYEVVGGNHDLEGIDEFPTDEENLEVFCKSFGKETAYFKRQIAGAHFCCIYSLRTRLIIHPNQIMQLIS